VTAHPTTAAAPTGSPAPGDRAAPARVPFASCLVTPEARQRAAAVLASGWLTTGPECARFESDLADWLGAREVVAVSSCTAALELSLRSLGLPPGC
jgi:perosamine synthetase